MAVTSESLLNIISLLNCKNDQVQSSNSRAMEELVLTLLVPPTPFTNKSVDQVSFAIETLLVSPSSDEESDAKHSIACLLACQNHEIAMKIFETKKDQLDSLVN